MMQLSLTVGLLWLTLVPWLGVMCCGAYYALRRPATHLPHPARLYRCPACVHVYEDRRNVPLAPCPRCGHPNEPIRR